VQSEDKDQCLREEPRGWNHSGRTVASYEACAVLQALQNYHLKLEIYAEHISGQKYVEWGSIMEYFGMLSAMGYSLR
jgi:hypothetical protein